jgi:hypothetical protein
MGVGTQDLLSVRQGLYHLSHSTGSRFLLLVGMWAFLTQSAYIYWLYMMYQVLWWFQGRVFSIIALLAFWAKQLLVIGKYASQKDYIIHDHELWDASFTLSASVTTQNILSYVL